MDKREFLKGVGASSLLLSIGISLESCSNESVGPQFANSIPITIDISSSKYSSLQVMDGWVLDSKNKILLVNVGNKINAFSNSCPHQGCTDNWGYASQTFTCGCHGSQFSNNGSLVSGPAQSGLKTGTVVQDGNILTITGL